MDAKGKLYPWLLLGALCVTMLMLWLLSPAVRGDTGPVCGVHYVQPEGHLEEASKHFEEAGFHGIHDFRVSRYDTGSCNGYRDLVRNMQASAQCTAFYQGDHDFSDTPCAVYLFHADGYRGAQGDFSHDDGHALPSDVLPLAGALHANGHAPGLDLGLAGQALPPGGCWLCWGGADGEVELGYTRGSTCAGGERGENPVVGQYCQGPDLTPGPSAVPLDGLLPPPAGAVEGIIGPNIMPPFGALEDDAPPSTTIKACRGPLPSLSTEHGAQDGCVTYVVSATSKAAPDYLSQGDDNTFRHFYHDGGAPACLGTGTKAAWGGGRDLNAQQDAAYIAQGYHVYAITGGSCSEAGVGLCVGPFCR